MSMTHQILAHTASQVSALAAFAQTGAAEPTAPTFWMPVGASTISQGVDHTLDVINWICYVFFALVVGLMVWFVVKYRHRTGDKFRTDAMVSALSTKPDDRPAAASTADAIA